MRLKVTKNENSTAVKEMDVNITGWSKFLVDLKKTQKTILHNYLRSQARQIDRYTVTYNHPILTLP